MNPTDKLLDLQRKADQAKSLRDRAKGKLEALYESLAKLGCKSLDEADKQMAELDDQISKKEKLLAKEIQKLEADYEW